MHSPQVLSNVGFFFFQSIMKKNGRFKETNSIAASLFINMISQCINRCFTLPFEV